jgi:hypothetical protein
VPEIAVDASSPVGLFRYRRQTVSEAENERLERCLSDLLLCQLHPHLTGLDATILIKGPPLSKLIGRIGYRYPRSEITIAFVTVDERYFWLPRHPPAMRNPGNEWDGPFPDFQQESLTRCFYSTFEPRLRVDFFTQALAHSSTMTGESGTGSELVERLHIHTRAIREFAKALRDHQPTASRLARDDVQRRLFKEHQSAESLAARGAAAESAPVEATQSRAPTMRPATTVSQPFSDREAFVAIFGDLQSKAAHGRLAALVTFAKQTGLGQLADNVEFLRFVRDTLEAQRYTRSWVFSESDLTRWYSECHEGRPGSRV